ncbi:hypothetical protein BH11PSE6_BH11PSE6_03340 [soil metagenome]
MHTLTFKQGAGMTLMRQDTTGCENAFYDSAACPESLSAVSRAAILVRDIDEPIQFPYGVEVISGYATSV